MNEEVIVHQVRSIASNGSQAVVHAYETAEEAKAAIAEMRQRTGKRYTVVQVPNQPAAYWGINFPTK